MPDGGEDRLAVAPAWAQYTKFTGVQDFRP